METPMLIRFTLNGRPLDVEAEPHLLLVELLRERLGLTGTHIGCDTSQCGACMVHLNGASVKSCTMLAVSADGADLVTIEGLAGPEGLHPMQRAFHEHHGLQCGFCTPGMIMSAVDLARRHPAPSEGQVRAWLVGNICRCTGYQNIVASVIAGAAAMHPAPAGE
jgi:aerobic carbon-monoxide dehydrogenase small subunit